MTEAELGRGAESERVIDRIRSQRKETTVMQIDKQQILEMLRSRGDDAKAIQAESELPDQVDTDQHSDLLSKLGINPADLLGGAGGIAGKLGL